jgi:Protein of unknown function (DUF4446)
MIQNNITPIVIALGALLLFAIALIVYLFRRTRRIEADCELLMRDGRGQNFAEIVSDNINQVYGLLREVERLSDQYVQVLRRMAGAMQHVGVVRFDAFRDLGGLMSFAIAMLDDRGNGLVISSIYGRTESRTYAKPVVERSSSYELSPEEREAIRLAMQSKELGALPVEARDREHEERMANLRLFHDREYLERSNSFEAREEARTQRAADERRPAPRRAPAREEEPVPERAPTREPRPRRPAGRAGRAGPPEDKTAGSPEESDREPTDEMAAPTGRPVDLVSELMDEPFEEETAKKERPPNRRARGLNTPVERLRDREPRGE